MLSAACLIGTVLLTSRLVALPALAVYALSFWHYLFYWWAYRYGAVQPTRFRRDAILMKSVALTVLASVYLAQPWHWSSAIAIGSGFMLNLAGARALGPTRTYYGWELGELTQQRVTSFPFSVLPHPMLMGNIVAFGGTLLHPGFRRAWWPLTVLHVALNGALIVMETSVTPKRRMKRTEAVTAPVTAAATTPLGAALAGGAAVLALVVGGAAVLALATSGASVSTLASGGAAVLKEPAGLTAIAIAVVVGASAAYGLAHYRRYVPASCPDTRPAPATSPDTPGTHARSQEVV